MQIKPMSDIVLIEPIDKEEISDGGIVLPEIVDDMNKVRYGKVKAVGPGKRNKKGRHVPVDVNVGDTVAHYDHTGLEYDIDGQKCLGMREDDLLAVMG